MTRPEATAHGASRVKTAASAAARHDEKTTRPARSCSAWRRLVRDGVPSGVPGGHPRTGSIGDTPDATSERPNTDTRAGSTTLPAGRLPAAARHR
ncbi:hypothetical protein [Oerskovia flava]|uniref:hypothetical protein n=1 Tax=Oerskovia flava TaxID=2986422 RepID=UPI00223ECD69|nr:hypothetical protein [Oerskovia sp. JB1-3-2]